MKDLKQCRIEIDEIDTQILALFEKRMHVARDVITYKLENDLEIFQPEREQEVLDKNVNKVVDQTLSSYALSFFQDMMDVSKSYQSSFIPIQDCYCFSLPKKKDITVGYQGVEGAFSYIALKEYFGDVSHKNYHLFEDVFQALKNKEIDYGIVPLENSSTGAINDNYDLVRDYDCYIVGEQSISISQHLLGVPGAKITDIKEVYSHPQGLLQCSEFLHQHPTILCHEYTNTAASAKYVHDTLDKSKGAIASKSACQLYGLSMIKENIHNETSNHTRFIVIGRHLEDHQETNRVSIVFTLVHKVGALYSILKAIKDHHINLTRIESRPIKDADWQYYFYIDFEGSLHTVEVQIALEQMKAHCLTLKVIGNYQQI